MDQKNDLILNEMRSTESKIDYDAKIRSLTFLQRKIHDRKIRFVAEKMKILSSVEVIPPSCCTMEISFDDLSEKSSKESKILRSINNSAYITSKKNHDIFLHKSLKLKSYDSFEAALLGSSVFEGDKAVIKDKIQKKVLFLQQR